ncbi:hypothetical protein, partial [Streptomyces prunicolor]|uniref:hypothetical protein n=1 Tax=Streptomyces prunicolor TaxID=67348 RepID=UPI0033ED6C77
VQFAGGDQRGDPGDLLRRDGQLVERLAGLVGQPPLSRAIKQLETEQLQNSIVAGFFNSAAMSTDLVPLPDPAVEPPEQAASTSRASPPAAVASRRERLPLVGDLIVSPPVCSR